MTTERRIRRHVTAFCPACHREWPARPLEQVRRLPGQLLDDDHVWLTRGCPDHGRIETFYEEDPEILTYLERWTAPPRSPTPDSPDCFDPVPGCFRSGLTGSQVQHTCILLEDITPACNLTCPTCFAASAPGLGEPVPVEHILANVDRRLELEGGSLEVVMVSGGEPTLHPHLDRLLDGLADRNIVRILLNSNGLLISHNDRLLDMLHRMRDRVEVYLQFDGMEPAASIHQRGRDLTRVKAGAVQRLSDAEVFTTLVMTAELGVNDHEIGDVAMLALETPFMAGVAIQPVFGSGRNRGIDPSCRLTGTGALRRLGPQTHGTIGWQDMIALPCSHPHCASVGYLLRSDAGEWKSLVGLIGHEQLAAHLDLVGNRIVDPSISLELKQLVKSSLGSLFSSRSVMVDRRFADLFRNLNSVCDLGIRGLLQGTATLSHDQNRLRRLLATRVKRIQVKPFMDIDTMLEERLLQCCVHVGVDGSRHMAVPFCAAQCWSEVSSAKICWTPASRSPGARPLESSDVGIAEADGRRVKAGSRLE